MNLLLVTTCSLYTTNVSYDCASLAYFPVIRRFLLEGRQMLEVQGLKPCLQKINSNSRRQYVNLLLSPPLQT